MTGIVGEWIPQNIYFKIDETRLNNIQTLLNTVHISLDCLLHKLFLKLVCAALRCMTLGFDGQEGSLHWKSLPGKTVPSSSPERKAHM